MLNSISLYQLCLHYSSRKKNKPIWKFNHSNKIQQFIQLSADLTEYSSPETRVAEAELKAKSKYSCTQHIHCWGQGVAAVCNRFCSSSCAPEENRGNQGQNKDAFLLSLQFYTKRVPGWNKIIISDQRKGCYGPCCNLSSSSMCVI